MFDTQCGISKGLKNEPTGSAGITGPLLAQDMGPFRTTAAQEKMLAESGWGGVKGKEKTQSFLCNFRKGNPRIREITCMDLRSIYLKPLMKIPLVISLIPGEAWIKMLK